MAFTGWSTALAASTCLTAPPPLAVPRLTATGVPSSCSAVDNILMKLAAQEVPFVRLGREAGVHPAVRPWVPGGARYPLKTTRELARLADCIPVVGQQRLTPRTCHLVTHLTRHLVIHSTGANVCPLLQFGATCFGVNHPMLRGRLFDVCIIDEAGQVGGVGGGLCAGVRGKVRGLGNPAGFLALAPAPTARHMAA
jgi:hypothetical protein